MFFISYSTRNETRAKAIKRELARAFYPSFLAKENLKPSGRYVEGILQKLRESDAIIAIVTPAFNASPFCQQELGAALALGKSIVPVIIGKELPRAMIGSVQGVRHKKLITTINSLDALRPMRVRTWIVRVGKVNSFEEADRLHRQFSREWETMSRRERRRWVESAAGNPDVTEAKYGAGQFYRDALVDLKR